MPKGPVKSILDGFAAETFGDLNAADYDDWQVPPDTPQTVDFLAEQFGDAKDVLEFAIGSGRLALPLQQRGFQLSGVEASQAMVDLMRQKPGGAAIEVHIGDMANFDLGRKFDHAFLVFNTLFNLTSQQAQIDCFNTAASHLRSGGKFIIECFVPDLSKRDGELDLITKQVNMQSAWLEASRHDRANQTLEMQRIRITEKGIQLVPLAMRYAYPPEIDLMAQLAGFSKLQTFADFNGAPFDGDSKRYIAVYTLK